MKRSVAVIMSTAAFASTLALGRSDIRDEPGRAGSASTPKASTAKAAPAPTRPIAAPTRDLLAFADEGNALQILAPPAAESPATELIERLAEGTPEPRARLIGFVRQGGRLRAVLALDGVVEVVGRDETRRGYRVVSLDDDALQVRVQTPEGETLEVEASASQ